MFAMYFIGRNGGYNNSSNLLWLAIGFVLLGLPQGINNVITYAMIGDTVEYLEWKRAREQRASASQCRPS